MEKACRCSLKWQIAWIHYRGRQMWGEGGVWWQFILWNVVLLFYAFNDWNPFCSCLCKNENTASIFFSTVIRLVKKFYARFKLERTFLLKYIRWPKVHCYFYTNFKALSYICLVLQMKFMGKGQKGKFLGLWHMSVLAHLLNILSVHFSTLITDI